MKAEEVMQQYRIAVSDADARLAEANDRLKSLVPAISQITKPRLAEIRMYQRPPKPVMALANVICLIFRKPMEWASARGNLLLFCFVCLYLSYSSILLSCTIYTVFHDT